MEQTKVQLGHAYEVLERELQGGPWMLGDTFTLADCAAAPALFYADTVAPLGEAHRGLEAYLGRLMGRPSFAQVLAQAEPYFSLFPLEQKPRLARP